MNGWIRRLLTRSRAATRPPLPRRDGPQPLSLRQEAEWIFHWEADGEAGHQPMLPRLTGPLRPVALRCALADVAARHETLRTRFPESAGEPVQVIEAPGRAVLPLIDLSGLDEETQRAEVRRIEAEAADHRFDLAAAPAVLNALLRLGPVDHGLLMCVPHLVADLWSMSLLTADLRRAYQARSQGQPSLNPAAVRYADLAAAERAHWTADRITQETLRWRRRLAGLGPLPLPTDHPRPAEPDLSSFSMMRELDAGLSDRLREFGRGHGVTLFVTMLAAFHALLARCCDVDRLITYSASAARRTRAAEDVVGLFSDYLVLVGDCTGDPAFTDLLARTKAEYYRAHDHQRLPFPLVQAAADPEHALRPHPLTQIGFSLHNTPPAVLDLAQEIAVGDFGIEFADFEPGVWTADLLFEVYDYGEGPLQLDLLLNAALFDHTAARLWVDRYGRVLEQIVDDPNLRLSDLRLSEMDIEAETAGTSQPATAPTFAEVLRRRVESTPDAVAVTSAGGQLTFAGLTRRTQAPEHDWIGRIVAATARLLARPGHPEQAAVIRDGLTIPERALIGEARAFTQAASLGVGDRVALLDDTDPAEAVALALVSGATVQREITGATAAVATPAAWSDLLAAGARFPPGLNAWCGPAPVPAWLVERLRAAGIRVHCRHGWPEAGMTLTAATDATAERGVASLGPPVATGVSVVDKTLTAPVAATAYQAAPRLTAELFTPDPASRGGRRHRGALRAMRTSGGAFDPASAPGHEWLDGRLVDTAAVERALTGCPGVTGAMVAVRAWPTSFGLLAPTLVGWLTGTRPPADEEVREHLRTTSPPVDVPSVLAWVPELGAAEPAGAVLLPPGTSPPRTAAEEALAVLWAQVLDIGDVRRGDNFFRLGGTARHAVRLAGAITDKWEITVPLTELMARPGLVEMAALLTNTEVMASRGATAALGGS